jgi:exosortase A-associated hydrolase 1
MQVTSTAFVIDVGAQIVVTLHQPTSTRGVGVVMVVGGRQIRAGSHRQYIRLARAFANAGYACIRFDLLGHGDSEGEPRDFEQNAEALSKVIDALQEKVPQAQRVVLWGLCDGATSAGLYAPTDPRVAGLLLANPWVRNETSKARALIATYYRRRFTSGAFWSRLLSGRVGVLRGLMEWVDNWRAAHGKDAGVSSTSSLDERLLESLAQFRGATHIVIAQEDLTGQEFQHVVQRNSILSRNLNVTQIDGADHTFSSPAWHQALERTSLDLLRATK